MKAIGQIDGNPKDGKTSLNVTRRGWKAPTDTVSWGFGILAGTPAISPRPDSLEMLGYTANETQLLVAGNMSDPITAGPNAGVFFFKRVPLQAVTDIRINTLAMSLNSAWYNMQETRRKNRGGGKPPWCAQSDGLPFIPKVQMHEGTNLESGSHAETFRRVLNELVPGATEGVVGFTVTELENSAMSAAAPGISAAKLQSQHTTAGGNVLPVSWPCDFKYFTN